MSRYSPIDILRKYVLRQCIQHLVETSNNPIWLNITFWENVTVKEYANRCWRRLAMALSREYPGIRLVGIWARQSRGAWHIHAVADRRVDIDFVRTKAMRAGFGPQMFLRELDGKLETPEKIARYISGYCTDKNALDKEKDKGVRRMIFLGKHVRIMDMRYRSGLKKITAIGRESSTDVRIDENKNLTKFEKDWSCDGKKRSWESWGDWYRRNRDYWFQMGWESLSNEERQEFLLMDVFTQRYLDTGQWSYI